MRPSRGFTLMELAVVTSIISLLVPLIFVFLRVAEADSRESTARLEAAEQARDLSEELRLDARVGTLASDELRFDGEGACFPVAYRLEERSLIRVAPAACGGKRAIARPVATLARDGRVLRVGFAALTDDAPISMVIALPERAR